MVSAVVLTKNEEVNIKECLHSLGWCDELVVIDDYSKDRTAVLAEKSGAKVFKRRLNGDFSAQRNFGLEKARGKWVLFVDADERVNQNLKAEILQHVTLQNYDGFFLKRKDYFLDRWLKRGETSKTKLLRLAKKGKGKWRRKVHEIWEVKGIVGQLKTPLEHYSHPTITDFLREINYYSTLHAKSLRNEKAQPNIFKIVLYPSAKFFQNYFFRLGVLDGIQGLMMALIMSFHSFLSWSKYWLKAEKHRN